MNRSLVVKYCAVWMLAVSICYGVIVGAEAYRKDDAKYRESIRNIQEHGYRAGLAGVPASLNPYFDTWFGTRGQAWEQARSVGVVDRATATKLPPPAKAVQ